MAGERVMVIEDDPALLRGLKDNLELEGCCVRTACDGETGLRLALAEPPDLLILDLMLPGVNGYEICRRLRSAGHEMPILMLTAKSHESDVVLGLNLGADDYMTKPFGIRELLARIQAQLRRGRVVASKRFRFGDYELDCAGRRLLRHGQEVSLTPKEYGVLELLLRQAGRAISRDELLRRVWGINLFVSGRSVDRCVTTLRAKIEPNPESPCYVQTVREVGYRFCLDSEDPAA